MKNSNSKPKRRLKKIKLGYIFAFLVIIAFAVVVLKLVLPAAGNNKYGDRLEGIENAPFTEKEKKKVIKNIKAKDQVVDCKIDVQGKIINVLFTVNKDTSKDDSKNIATGSLADFSDVVKGYYDIQFMVSKKGEEGTKVTKQVDDETTKEVTVYEFPIMGYKNKKSDRIVW
jgi:hypothetical protein